MCFKISSYLSSHNVFYLIIIFHLMEEERWDLIFVHFLDWSEWVTSPSCHVVQWQAFPCLEMTWEMQGTKTCTTSTCLYPCLILYANSEGAKLEPDLHLKNFEIQFFFKFNNSFKHRQLKLNLILSNSN